MVVYFAAIEAGDAVDLIPENAFRCAFFSYYYCRKGQAKNDILIKSRPHMKLITIDSGAHSFFSEHADSGLTVSFHKKKTKTKESPQEYFEKYVDWIKKHWDFFDYFVELDIGEIVGQQTVLAWRERLKAEGLYTKCITVYHPGIMSWDDYIRTLDDSQSRYVALEGDRTAKRNRLPYRKMIKAAYDRGVKTHGFAMTKLDVFHKYPFFSVDSSSWKAAAQYGSGRVVSGQGTKIIRYRDKNALKDVDLHHNWKEAYSDNKRLNRNQRYRMAIQAFQKLADEDTTFWEANGITYPEWNKYAKNQHGQ